MNCCIDARHNVRLKFYLHSVFFLFVNTRADTMYILNALLVALDKSIMANV